MGFKGVVLRSLKVKKWENVGFCCKKGENVG
jgi:hypothetical protein